MARRAAQRHRSAAAAAAVVDASADTKIEGKPTSVPGLEMLMRQLHEPEPLMRARAAGVLFNVAGFGPDCRLAMLEQKALAAVVEALASDAGRGTTVALKHAIEARLAGCRSTRRSTRRAARPSTSAAACRSSACSARAPIVLTTASTAIAYSTQGRHRPGALDSSVRSTDGAGVTTSALPRPARAAPPPDPDAPADSRPVEPDEGEEAPNTKATYGTLPLAKLGATHDSRSKVSPDPTLTLHPHSPTLTPTQTPTQALTLLTPTPTRSGALPLPLPLPAPRGPSP